MDHLPQLRDPPSFRVEEVPFLEDARFVYDGAGLEGFPERCEFIFNHLGTNLDASAVFQSWLFFGTLTEIFKEYDIPVLLEDFVSRAGHGHAVITTKFLQDYIAAWIVTASREYPGILDRDKYYSIAREFGGNIGSKIGSVTGQAVISLIRAAHCDTAPSPTARQVRHSNRQLWKRGREMAKARAARIRRVLETVATILRNFGPPSGGINNAVWDSVLVLCTTLQTAAFFIYRACPLEAPFTVPFSTLLARLSPALFRQNGWCPREEKIIADLVEGDHCALLLCAQLDRRHNNVCHSKCNAGECVAYRVDLDTYHTQHHQGCHGCDLVGFDGFDSNDAASSKLVEIVMRDQTWLSASRPTPMATYSSEGQLRLVPVSVRLLRGETFVAISHVWADGLGNASANALPRCQLARIQDLVNKQFPDKKAPIPFWMDTLCIPVAKDKPQEFKTAKERAIEHMEGIYKFATSVLVLDRTLTDTSSHGMSAEEIGLRIMCSGWARRLWTLQEGLFQAQVHYQFKDTTHTYKHLNEDVRQKHAFPARSVTVPQTHFLLELLANPPNSAADSFEPLARFAHKSLSCCWPRISSFFKELNIRYSQPDPAWFPGMQLIPGMSILVPRAMRTIAYRTTSRIEDEGLILASLTNWRAGSAKALIKMQPKERLRACFEQFAIVPSQLIFLDQQRYYDDGARWIPQSILTQSSTGTAPLPFEHAIISDEFSWPSPAGITADYPSFHLALPPGWAPSKGHQKCRLDLAGHSYIGFVHDAGSQKAPASLPSNLALIVPRSIRSGPWKSTAALVSILDERPNGHRWRGSGFVAGLFAWGRDALANYHDKRRMVGRHEALVDLKRVAEGQGADETLPLVEALRVTECTTPEGNTRWRIG